MIIDKSERFCLECKSPTTYVSKSSTGTLNYKWYKVLGGFICNNCKAKRRYHIKRQQENQEQTPIKLLVYNVIK